MMAKEREENRDGKEYNILWYVVKQIWRLHHSTFAKRRIKQPKY